MIKFTIKNESLWYQDIGKRHVNSAGQCMFYSELMTKLKNW